MALKISYENPDFPKEMEFDIGVGVPIPNGSEVELTEEQELAFVARTQSKVKDYYADSPSVKVSGTTELTPTQLKDHIGSDVNVEPEVDEEAVTGEPEEEGVNE